jgi:hypothetical protein
LITKQKPSSVNQLKYQLQFLTMRFTILTALFFVTATIATPLTGSMEERDSLVARCVRRDDCVS